MDRNQRAARQINMRKAKPLRRPRTTPIPETVLADLDIIDAATNDPTIREAVARIRIALNEQPQPEPGVHIGGIAENCPACDTSKTPHPFPCPGA